MKKAKTILHKISLIIICATLFVGMFQVNVKMVSAATSHSMDEALAWVKSLEGTAYDYDGVYGAQCVDLVKGYYNYLGAKPANGNGCDYATNTLPSGWTRIKGGTPQKGDILVYSGNSSNQYGHVAIYESEYILWHGRLNGKGIVQKTTSIRYNGFSNPYWGLIRPNFTDSFSVSNTGVTNITETTARINAKVSPGANVTEVGFYLGTSPDNMQKHEEKASLYVESIWYDLGTGKWTGALNQETTYYYQIYAVIGGTTYKSTVDSFTTGGKAFRGSIDYCSGGLGIVHVSGWAMDMNNMSKSIEAHVYIGGPTESYGSAGVERFVVSANGERTDVGNAYPGAGNYHGYEQTLNTSLSGNQPVYVYAYNPETCIGYYIGNTTVTITQNVIPTSVSLNKTNLTMTCYGQTEQLTATVSPGDATNKAVTWTSSNPSVATVDGNGLVTSVGNGSATITATTVSGGKTATCAVTVHVPVEGVNLNRLSANLTEIGQTVQLTATVLPNNAANKNVTWKSSNTNVATVDSNGLVTAVGDGTANITVTTVDGNKMAVCTVTVKTKTEISIVSQPANQYVKDGNYTTFTVSAKGDGLNYQWQFSSDGTTWNNSGMTGAKTATLKVQGTKARNGQQYRCVVTDAYGEKLISSPAKLYVLGISTQPVSQSVTAGTNVKFKVGAYGGNLTYQWQYKAIGGSTWINSGMTGAKTSTLTVEALEKRNGQQYRCVVTDGSGNTVASTAATLTVKEETVALAITTNPVNKTVTEGDTAVFKVVAQGESLSYQWQFKAVGSSVWKNSGMTGAKTPSLIVVGTAARNGQQYRCVVTDGSGNTVTSKAAALTVKAATVELTITSNPANKTITEGATAVFKVVAQGEGLTYQWQFSKDNGVTWGNSGMTGAKTASLSVVGTAARNGQQYRCVITDGSGNTVTSKAAVLTVKVATEELVITTNPSNKTVKEGEKAVFTVVAQGEGLSYQWQFSKDKGVTWGNSGMTGAKTANLTVEGTAARNGQMYRCVVTDGNGNQVISNAATLTVSSKATLAITTNPTSQAVNAGDSAVFTVVAQGEKLTYQWQYKAVGSSEWKNSGMTGAKTASLTVVATAARNGQQYRCVVTDGNGDTVTSKAAGLIVFE